MFPFLSVIRGRVQLSASVVRRHLRRHGENGFGADPMDEAMNRRPGMPTILGHDTTGSNATGLDRVSGFRSMHMVGCNFLFADGSVHFLPQAIDPVVYRALSSYAGGEVVSSTDY